MGQIDILNTGAGHLVIKVPDDQSEIDKANSSRIITDMLRRGYLLFLIRDGKHIKVDSYDEKAGEYILANYPEAHVVAAEIAAEEPVKRGPGRPRKDAKPRVEAKKANVTAVGRSAGG